ncbi:MAG: sugar phosphate isomerase/epimerase [Chitinophagaceae bacterium]|nr:sugar phosphate isomerase/epimerase [Chitinophagaceae bacterium]
MAQNRRAFIRTSASATTALLLSSLDVLAAAKPDNTETGKNFTLKILATNWGFNGTLDAYCEKVKKEGYDGIEIWWPMEMKDQDELFTVLKKYNLEAGFLCGAYQPDYQQHLDHFKRMIDAAAMNKAQRPLYINCHSGRDFFSYDENLAFIHHTNTLAKNTGILICHETHRSRMLFASSVGRQFIEKNPELKITLDVSHWCNVSESLLQDQTQTMQLALERTEHIHARIGHSEGPQVSDPRAPEWEPAVKAHLAWWDAVVERKKKNGEVLTILTEFGPPDYMPVLPYTRQPVADQWAINVHMMHLLRNRYQTK